MDAAAQYNLGNFYRQGIHGLTESSKRAFEYYTLAAEQGLANAQGNVGLMYVNGDGIEQSNSNGPSTAYSVCKCTDKIDPVQYIGCFSDKTEDGRPALFEEGITTVKECVTTRSGQAFVALEYLQALNQKALNQTKFSLQW